MADEDEDEDQIWTIGHSTLTEAEFVEVLETHGVQAIADVRAHPGSRTSPHFARDRMPEWLAESEIGYLHIADLGGRRRKQDAPAELNSAWRNASFKNYADYTLTQDYEAGIETLTAHAKDHRVALMCSETLPWRCHRLLVSNTLTARRWTVRHIIGDGEPSRHELGQWGAEPQVDEQGRLIYPDRA